MKFIDFLASEPLPLLILALLATFLIGRWIFPKKTWKDRYHDLQEKYDIIHVKDLMWQERYPDMPEDVRLWNVMRDLEDEFEATRNQDLDDMIHDLKLLHKKTPYYLD